MNEIMPILSQENIEKAINDIESLNLYTATKQEIDQCLSLLIRGYQMEVPIFEPGIELYRGIIRDKPVDLSGLSYPPCEYASLGRANDNLQSLFYAATSRDVPFYELRVSQGDYVALSKWKVKSNLTLNHIGFRFYFKNKVVIKI